MGIKAKLIGIITCSLLGFVFFSVFAWNTLNTTMVNGPLYHQIVQGKDLIADVLPPPAYIIESFFIMHQIMDENDAVKVKELVEKSLDLRKEYDERHEYWKKNLPEGQLKNEMVARSYAPAQAFFEIRDKEFFPAIQTGEREKAAILMRGALKAKYAEHRAVIDQVVKLADEGLKREESNAADIIQVQSLWLIGIAAAIILITTSLGYFYADRAIVRTINNIISRLNDSSNLVTSESGHVSSSSQTLAEASSEQAASLEETSASLEEISSMTMQNAENARVANSLVGEANQVIDKANQSMNQLTGAMKEIAQSSEETQKIVKTIDEIAFQTNLLALNAAVEAARAGEAGAGFAVVADEVRNLAMRAAEAAKNTSTLIDGSVKRIKDGTSLVDSTNARFTEVSTSSKKIADLVAEINAASTEQAQGIDQINKAVSEMDKVVQQNAANAEESASASQELNALAEQMKAAIGELAGIIDGNASRAQKADITRNRIDVAKKEKRQIKKSGGRSPSSQIAKQVIPLNDADLKDF